MSARRRRSSPGAMPMGVAGGPSRISRSSRAAGSRDYKDRTAQVADIVLLAEVTDSSPQDRTVKLAGYAQAGLMVYWILDLGLHQLEVYSGPITSECPAAAILGETGSVELIIQGQVVGQIAVADLLPVMDLGSDPGPKDTHKTVVLEVVNT